MIQMNKQNWCGEARVCDDFEIYISICLKWWSSLRFSNSTKLTFQTKKFWKMSFNSCNIFRKLRQDTEFGRSLRIPRGWNSERHVLDEMLGIMASYNPRTTYNERRNLIDREILRQTAGLVYTCFRYTHRLGACGHRGSVWPWARQPRALAVLRLGCGILLHPQTHQTATKLV